MRAGGPIFDRPKESPAQAAVLQVNEAPCQQLAAMPRGTLFGSREGDGGSSPICGRQCWLRHDPTNLNPKESVKRVPLSKAPQPLISVHLAPIRVRFAAPVQLHSIVQETLADGHRREREN